MNFFGKPLKFSFLGLFCCLRFVILFQALAMPPKLQIPNNFEFKYFFGGQVPKKAFAFNESISFDYLNLITWVSKKNQLQNPKLIIIPPHDCNTILEMFELLENPNPIVIEDVHCFNFKK